MAWLRVGMVLQSFAILLSSGYAVDFEVLPSQSTLRPDVRLKSATAYCEVLDIMVMMGGYYTEERGSFLTGDFWLYSFPNSTWHDMSVFYSTPRVSPALQFGGTLTYIESVTSHCRFLLHSGKVHDPCRRNFFGNSYFIDIEMRGGEYTVSTTVVQVPEFSLAYSQKAVYHNNSVFFVGGAKYCKIVGRGRSRRYQFVFRRGVFRYKVDQNLWEKLLVADTGPTIGVEHMMALYDKPNDPQLILHGGNTNTAYLYDVWSFSLTDFQFKRLTAPGSKMSTRSADMHVVGDAMYIYGGFQTVGSGLTYLSSSVVLTHLNEKSYGCVTQGREFSFCEMHLGKSIGHRVYYASIVRQDRLVLFGGVRNNDQNLYALDLTDAEVERIAEHEQNEETPFAVLHLVFVAGTSLCLLVVITAVLQRILVRRQLLRNRNVEGQEGNEPVSAGVSENVLKALPVVIYQGQGKEVGPTKGSTTLQAARTKDESGDIELAIMDIAPGSGNTATDLVEKQNSAQPSDAASSSGSSTGTTSSTPREGGPGLGVESDTPFIQNSEAGDNCLSTNESGSSVSQGETFETCGDLCAICICDYDVGDELRVLPCNHSFHTGCIDTWLQRSKSCPMCKQDIVVAD